MRRHIYICRLRPAGFATLPGIDWEYVTAPAYITQRPDLPRSRHPHGTIATTRELSADEVDRFGLELIATEDVTDREDVFSGANTVLAEAFKSAKGA
jgi:hypothetical protein